MSNERLQYGLHHCSKCTDQSKPKGVMEYSHKAGGVLVVTDDKGFRELKKTANERR